jgi:hypothetical protein
VLAELAAVAVEHVARQAVPGLTAVEQVMNARRWYPDFTHTDRQGQAAQPGTVGPALDAARAVGHHVVTGGAVAESVTRER